MIIDLHNLDPPPPFRSLDRWIAFLEETSRSDASPFDPVAGWTDRIAIAVGACVPSGRGRERRMATALAGDVARLMKNAEGDWPAPVPRSGNLPEEGEGKKGEITMARPSPTMEGRSSFLLVVGWKGWPPSPPESLFAEWREGFR